MSEASIDCKRVQWSHLTYKSKQKTSNFSLSLILVKCSQTPSTIISSFSIFALSRFYRRFSTMYSSASNQFNNLFVPTNAEMDQLNHQIGDESYLLVPRAAAKTYAINLATNFQKHFLEAVDNIETFYRASQPVFFVQASNNSNTAGSNVVNVSNGLENRRNLNVIPSENRIPERSENSPISKYNSTVKVRHLKCEELVHNALISCGKIFSDAAKLREHLQRDHGIKPYQCFSRNCYQVSFTKS